MEETQSVSDATQENASGNSEGLKQQYEQEKQDNVAYESYRKAVSQRKKALSENDELKSRLERLEHEKMSHEGRKDELIKSLREQLDEKESKLKSSQSAYTWNVVGAQIKGELASRGVRNPDKALKFATAAHKDDLGAIEVDDSFNVHRDDLTRFVDKFLQENQDMGFVGKSSVKDMAPSNRQPVVDAKSTAKMSDEEIMKKWKELEG